MAENITYKLADLGSPLFTSRSSQVFLLKSDDSSDTKDDASKLSLIHISEPTRPY